MNVPQTIAVVMSLKPELYTALCTDLGLEQLYDILEVISVDANNARMLAKRRERR